VSREPCAVSPEPLLYCRDMNDRGIVAKDVQDSRSRAGTYVAVILVEALVVSALYLFSRYFSA
jgi:hypothetical protein